MRKALLAIFLLFSFNLYGAGAKIDIPKLKTLEKVNFGLGNNEAASKTKVNELDSYE